MADIRDFYSEAGTVGFNLRSMCQIIKMLGLDKLVLVEQRSDYLPTVPLWA